MTPVEVKIMPYGSEIDFVWSIPAVLLGTATGFNALIENVSEEVVEYRDNLISESVCNEQGSCASELIGGDLSKSAENFIWTVGTKIKNDSAEIAEALFKSDDALTTANSENTDTATADPDAEKPGYSEDFLAIKAAADVALASFDSWYELDDSIMDSDQGYHMGATLRGLAQVYHNTDDRKYLDKAVILCDRWINSGIDFDGDGYKQYLGKPGTNLEGLTYIEHHEWRAGAGLADVLIEIQRTGYEGDIPGIKQKIIDFLRTDVWESWSIQRGRYAHYNRTSINRANSLGYSRVESMPYAVRRNSGIKSVS